uniref:C-C motif chemokine n=1 Tax=Denticeps clupeoides TaxID=299321 RepID=A0AAY4B4F1_9TELE
SPRFFPHRYLFLLGCQETTPPTPGECCFDFYTKRIPVSRIQSFKVSHADCPKKGIILKTVKDVELCVNPADQSIQDLMEKVMWGQKVSSGQE